MLEDCLVMTDIMKLTASDIENNNKNDIEAVMHHTSPSSTVTAEDDTLNILQKFLPNVDSQVINIPIWNYDDFELEYLNEGFFGNVYKAKHRPTDELFVLKVIKEEEEENHRASFVHEVCLLCRLSHQNVLKIKGITFQNGQLCCLSEYISGGSLFDMLYSEDSRKLSWLGLLNMTLDIARGMHYLHGKGVIHRDLTAKNILAREVRKDRFEAVIIDFGLSYQQPDVSSNCDKEEPPCGPEGSTFYIAPELFHGKQCSKKSDVFAFGIVLCEMITECTPEVSSAEDLPRSNDYGLDFEEFNEMVNDCPTEFLNLAVRCCQVKPEYRPHFSDIMKIVDIIIDHTIEQSFQNIDNVVITPRKHDISISGTGQDAYILDHCLLCSCEDSVVNGDSHLSLSTSMENIGLQETFDRFGGVMKTGSRRLMRKYFKRCSVCGGRLLNLDGEEVDELEDEEVSYMNSTEKKDGINSETLKQCVIGTEPSPVKSSRDFVEKTEKEDCQSDSSNDNSPDEPETPEQRRTRSPPQDIPEVRINPEDGPLQSDSFSSESPVTLTWNTLEKMPKNQAGSLLRHMNSDITKKTSQLALNTPGRLPRFFSHIMKRRKGSHRLNKDTERRGSRINLQKFFNMKSFELSSMGVKNLTPLNTPDLSASSPSGYHGRRRFTFSKHRIEKEELDRRRLSMPITTGRDCVSGPNSPTREHSSSFLSSKSLKNLDDIDGENDRQIKSNSTHKRYSSHYKGGLASTKKSRSLVDLLFRRKHTEL